jgi:acetylornithine/succinyldiaminopimelate/putrescine aminotransferase
MNRNIKVILLSVMFFLSTIFVLFATSNAIAQSRPAVHWSTFDKNASQCACHLFSLKAMRSEGLNQVFEDTGTIILAGNNQLIAETVCLPNNRQIRLSVYSSDSQAAAQARNNIREKIVKSVLFDTCP